MFEARHISAAHVGDPKGAALRTPAWEELVARLAAARDLRRTLTIANRGRGGSFVRFAHHDAGPVNAKQGGVNQPGLADGRAAAGIVGAATEVAVSADRDTQ